MRWVGEGELQGDAMENLLKYMPVTVFIILMILLMLFNTIVVSDAISTGRTRLTVASTTAW